MQNKYVKDDIINIVINFHQIYLKLSLQRMAVFLTHNETSLSLV